MAVENDFLPFATGSGANVLSQSSYAALSAISTGYQAGIAQSAALNKTWRQSSIMAAVLAQFIVNTTGQTAIDDGTTATLLANLVAAVSAQSEALIGAVRNLSMSVSAASATATLTADEIIVGSALGGLKYTLATFSKTINLATTGAGGMDSGSAPASGFVALYAIYNPTTATAALLATNATSAKAPSVYGGVNMPAGYTASALVSVWPTNSSSLFIIGFQNDRRISFANNLILSTASTASSLTALTSTAIPLNARTGLFTAYGTTSISSAATLTQLAATSGSVFVTSNGTNAGYSSASGELPIVTPQTIYWIFTTASGTPAFSINLCGYTI
jgi:hypothetical protein